MPASGIYRGQTLRLRRWRPGDEDAFTPRADFAEQRAAVGWDWTQGAPGPTWTVLRWNGDVVGVGGFIQQGLTEFAAWAWLAEVQRRDWPQLIWLAQRALTDVRTHHGARAIAADAATPAASRLLGRLHFTAQHWRTDPRLPDQRLLRMMRRA